MIAHHRGRCCHQRYLRRLATPTVSHYVKHVCQDFMTDLLAGLSVAVRCPTNASKQRYFYDGSFLPMPTLAHPQLGASWIVLALSQRRQTMLDRKLHQTGQILDAKLGHQPATIGLDRFRR